MCTTDRADGISLKYNAANVKLSLGFWWKLGGSQNYSFFSLFFIAKPQECLCIIIFLYI